MATALDIRRKLFGTLLGRSLTQEDLNAVGGEQGLNNVYGNNESGQYNEIINSQEYKDKLMESARKRFGITRDTTLQDISANEAKAKANTEAANESARLNTQNQIKALEERKNELGTLVSGGTNSNLMAERAGLAKTLNTNDQNLADTMTKYGFARTTANANYNQSVEDWYNNMIENAQNNAATLSKGEQDAAIKSLDIAKDIPYGQSIDIPGLGTIMGLKQNSLDTSVVSVGNRQVLIDNQTGETIRDIGPVSRSGSSSSKKTETEKKNEVISSLQEDVKQGIQEIINAGFPEYATEDLINELINAYPELDPQDIQDRVYMYRSGLERKYKF